MSANDQPTQAEAMRPDDAEAPASVRTPHAPVPLREAAARLGADPVTWRAAARLFPVRWPAAYLALAESPEGEPVRLMGMPHADELAPADGELEDPVGEATREEFPFVVRKHRDRAILLVSAACHFYCRFCFRRSFPDGSHRSPSADEVAAALAHLRGESDLREVILSGGDPLTLSDARVAATLAGAASIPQVERLRVHSRAPIHEPARVTPALARAMVRACAGKPLRLVTHPNHAVEITPAAREAVAVLREQGIEVLGQSVLLRGVNDSPAALAALLARSREAGIAPYYLHHPDRVRGAARFFVGIARGLALHAELVKDVAPELLPAYVIDVPDGSGKVPVASLVRIGDRRYRAPSGFEWDDVAEG